MNNVPILLSKKPANTLQHTIFLGIVRVVLAWDFQEGGECGGVGVDAVSYSVGDLRPSKYNGPRMFR